jgi:hypothetical protein
MHAAASAAALPTTPTTTTLNSNKTNHQLKQIGSSPVLTSSQKSSMLSSSSPIDSISYSSSNNSFLLSGNQINNASVYYQNSYTDIQAQFELSVELRKFINIDLFQRGYYQIRLYIRCANKQIPTKIIVQLENNPNNQNLSELMFPSCVIDDYAVSKTFLILYRNEEIILDDHIIFKISTLVNAFNVVDSFEKLDLQLNVELWFTENDYIPQSVLNRLNMSNNNSNSVNSADNANATGNNNNAQNGTNSNDPNSNNGVNTNINSMQLLCSRNFKIKFDPRQGVHLQVPVLFDYFHLSAVLVTIHCALLTLLPPVMLG